MSATAPDRIVLPPPARCRWLSPGEVADVLRCSTATVLAMIRDGRLPALKLNRRVYRVSAVDLAAFEATRLLRPTTPSNSAQLRASSRGRRRAKLDTLPA